MYRDHRIAALVPAYNEQNHIARVVQTMPESVDHVIIVDDASTDDTRRIVEAQDDERIRVVLHDVNQGLGASLIDANLAALELDADIMVVMAGDGQMDPAYLPALFDPLIDEGYDFTKGNRFFSLSSWRGMPRHRIVGNIGLSFLTRVATGYWNLFDPQNGYTAITRTAAERIDWSELARDYSYENDVIAHLGLICARIKDVDIPALYGDEVSSIRLRRVVPDILRTLRRAFFRRLWLQHMVRGFSPLALFLVSGVLLLAWAAVLGVWAVVSSVGPTAASTGTVMLAVVPFLMGFELLLAAAVLDILGAPK